MSSNKQAAELTPSQQKLFDENSQYIRSLAGKYSQHFDDLYSEGLLALYYSVQEYDPNKSSASFRSYVTRSFYNAVTNYFLKLARERDKEPIKIKEMKDQLRELEQVMDDIKTIPYPVETEAREELEEQIVDLRKHIQESSGDKLVSLDQPISFGDEDEGSLLETLRDLKEVRVEDIASYNEFKSKLKQQLSEKNFKILELAEGGYSNDEISEIIRKPSTGEGVSHIIIHEIAPVIKSILYS